MTLLRAAARGRSSHHGVVRCLAPTRLPRLHPCLQGARGGAEPLAFRSRPATSAATVHLPAGRRTDGLHRGLVCPSRCSSTRPSRHRVWPWPSHAPLGLLRLSRQPPLLGPSPGSLLGPAFYKPSATSPLQPRVRAISGIAHGCLTRARPACRADVACPSPAGPAPPAPSR